MGFSDEIIKSLGGSVPLEPSFKVTLFGEGACFIQNVCGIRYYTENEISLCLKKGELILRGEGLYVKKFCEGDLVVCGKILLLERK